MLINNLFYAMTHYAKMATEDKNGEVKSETCTNQKCAYSISQKRLLLLGKKAETNEFRELLGKSSNSL